jgi:multidrug efflux pump subunit AcrA (membrane-fusion protein)
MDEQADMNMGGQPSFLAEVLVDFIQERDRSFILAGMSADVHIRVKQKKALMVPVKALHERNGNMMVTVWNERTQTREERVVKVGETSVEYAVILENLKVGEKIIYT